MNGLLDRLYRFVLGWLQSRCVHPSESVVADLLEGDGGMDAVQVQWCRICGATQTVYTSQPAGGLGGMVPQFGALGGIARFAQAGGILGALGGGRRHPLRAEGGCNKACYGAASCVVGWPDGSCGGLPQGTARPPVNATNPTFPLHTGWRRPEPRWQDGGRSFRRDLRADEEGQA
jgi:hypothetical protein